MRLTKCSWILAFVCSSLASGASPADEPKEKQQPPPPLPSRFADLVRATEKAAESIENGSTRLSILIDLAAARRFAGDKIEARKILDRASGIATKSADGYSKADGLLEIAKERAMLGEKVEAGKLLGARSSRRKNMKTSGVIMNG